MVVRVASLQLSLCRKGNQEGQKAELKTAEEVAGEATGRGPATSYSVQVRLRAAWWKPEII